MWWTDHCTNFSGNPRILGKTAALDLAPRAATGDIHEGLPPRTPVVDLYYSSWHALLGTKCGERRTDEACRLLESLILFGVGFREKYAHQTSPALKPNYLYDIGMTPFRYLE